MLLLAAFGVRSVSAVPILFAWSPYASPDVAGYEVAYGTSSGNYDTYLDAGFKTSQVLRGLSPGTTYYLTVFPYDLQTNPGPMSDEVVYTVPADAAGVPPQITGDPVSQTAATGANILFTVGVSGTPPLSFQWFDNGLPLLGETNDSLSLSSVGPADMGSYSVEVINAMGTAMSMPAALAVADLPNILSQPQSLILGAGTNAAFNIVADSPTPMTMQWFHNGLPLDGETNASLFIPSADETNDGLYTVVLNNSLGTVSGNPVTLSVINPPRITSQPLSQTSGAGLSLTLQVGATGSAPLLFQWYHLGIPVPHGNGPILVLNPVTAADTGGYYVEVQNAVGIADSDRAILTVTNVYQLSTGVYDGLFYQTNGNQEPVVDVSDSGIFDNCIVTPNGVYSARLQFGGNIYSLSGALDANGSDSEIVPLDGDGQSNLMVSVNLDLTGGTQTIVGTVSNMDAASPWCVPLVAYLATNALPVPTAVWYITIPPTDLTDPNSPQGYMLLDIYGDGSSTLVGQLNDGTTFTEAEPVAFNGAIPVYSSLYSGTGLIEGWISLATGEPEGQMTWIRPDGVVYSPTGGGGITNTVNIY
jgi:hypothetical protein